MEFAESSIYVGDSFREYWCRNTENFSITI
jgi:hypothetical protein